MSDQPAPRRDRTPLVLGIIAGVLAVAVAVTLTIALTRGGAEPETAPPSTPGQAASPADQGTPTTPTTEESSEPAVESAAVQLLATGFTLVDDAGAEVFAYGWSDPIEPAVTALTEAFGAEPTERTEAGNGTTYPDYTVYQWTGFALYDMVPIDGGKTRDEYSQPSYLRYTANTVGDVSIAPEFDLQIGLPVDEARALGPDVEEERGGNPRLVFGADRSSFAGGVPSYSLIADTDGEKITAILYFYYSAR
jgi:hypothetical protein